MDGLAVEFVGPLPVRTMALGGVCMAGATGLSALHLSFQYGSLAKILQVLQLLLPMQEALRIAIRA
jgi:hypothetical protein